MVDLGDGKGIPGRETAGADAVKPEAQEQWGPRRCGGPRGQAGHLAFVPKHYVPLKGLEQE